MSEWMHEALHGVLRGGRRDRARDRARSCPVDGSVLLERPLPQDGRSRLCPSCGTWWA